MAHYKIDLLKCTRGYSCSERTDDARLLCYLIASASFTSRDLSNLCVDWLRSKITHDPKALLIATSSGGLLHDLLEKDSGLSMYPFLLLLLTGIGTSISCTFTPLSSVLYIFRNSSRHHSMLMSLSLSMVTNLNLLFGFCAACMLLYKCIQIERWAVETDVYIFRLADVSSFSFSPYTFLFESFVILSQQPLMIKPLPFSTRS